MNIRCLLGVCVLSVPCAGQTLYERANIWTGDAAMPRVSAMYVRDGKVAAVGVEAVEAAARDGARRVDLEGRTVLPGLIDAHGHLMGLGAFGLGRLDLSSARSFDEVVVEVRQAAERVEKGSWILGGRWDHESWPERVLPSHALLSEASPDHPVWLRRVDGHAGIANARALALAGIHAETPDPPGGEIMRDVSGRPTGVLIDNAMDLLERVLPDESESAERVLLEAQSMCFSVGLTCVHDMGVSPQEVEMYKRLEGERRLKLRVYALVPSFHAMRYFEERGVYIGDRLVVRGAKAYMDGAMGSRGAWLLEAYADRAVDDAGAAYVGLSVSEPSFIRDLAAHGLEKGYQVCVHAIGDRANREVLDAYRDAWSVAGGVGDASPRFRIEHAQLLHADDIGRLARTARGVIASMQPTHCTSDMRWVEARIGRERARGAYAWSSLLRAGTVIAGGSDFPVESHNPFFGFYAAVTRQDRGGMPEGGWLPEERVTREEALRMFTMGAAYAGFMEGRIGSLSSGKEADFIVVDRDPMTCEVRDLAGARVLRTVIAGETVFDAAR